MSGTPDVDPNTPPAGDPPGDESNAEMEARARRMGWRPQEEFRGDPNRWTDAKTFVERGENELPVLRERYRTLDDRLARVQTDFGATRQELTELRQHSEEMKGVLKEFRERSVKAEEIGYARARRELEEQMARSVEQADANGYNRAKIELDRLNEAERISRQPPPPPAPVAPAASSAPAAAGKIDPVIEQWVSENQWFNSDQGMAGYATALFQKLRNERPGLSPRDQLDIVREDVVKRFPEKFENPRRQSAPAVNSPNTPPSAPSRKKGPPPFEQWPAEARQSYERFKRQMPDYKPEEYAAMYFAGDES